MARLLRNMATFTRQKPQYFALRLLTLIHVAKGHKRLLFFKSLISKNIILWKNSEKIGIPGKLYKLHFVP